MPVVLGQALAMVGGVLATMGMQLLTSNFLKRAVVIALEKIVKRTESQEDDELLKAAKQAWGVE